MNEYREVVKFYYSDVPYIMFLDQNNRHFFLKNQDKLEYISLKELIVLTNCFTNFPLIMNAKKGQKIKMIPKILLQGSLVTLSLATITVAGEMIESRKRIDEFDKNYISSSPSFNEYLSYDDNQNEKKELEVDTFLESEKLNYLYIYDTKYLNKIFDYQNVTLEQVKNRITENNQISEKFKKLLFEYLDLLIKKYPNVELRIFYENLKNLEIIECSKEELIKKSLSVDSYGCYIRTENKIYVLKDYEYKKGTWGYQVIFHEFSHCLRTGSWNIENKKVKAQIEGQNYNNTIIAEALNSLFTVSIFDYEENDIAYQLQSNYLKVMLECMDNYSLEDYMNHSLSYFAKKLDEWNHEENYATTILELIQIQYTDYHNTKLNINQNGYYPLYEYITHMYLQKNLKPGMSYEDATILIEKLLQEILYDVPSDYNIDTTYFYKILQNYYDKEELENNLKK